MPARAPLELPEAAPLAPPEGLDAQLASLGVALSPAQVEALGAYLAALLAMNERMNLTAVTEPAAAWTRHALDALSLAPPIVRLAPGARVLDVGSGGGVPGVPLAIAAPHVEVVLLEATQKKAAFLEAVAARLGLGNVRVVAARAEDARALFGGFDVVTARAVARLLTLLEWTAPFARPGGRLLLIKGQRADEELAEARRALARAGVSHVETQVTPTGRVVVLERRG